MVYSGFLKPKASYKKAAADAKLSTLQG